MLLACGMVINSYRDLDVWFVSMDLVDRVLADLKAMPRVEFDLRRQIKRAVISIPSNVAEGGVEEEIAGLPEPCLNRDGIARRAEH